MTDNSLVEAVAMPLRPASRSDADLQRDPSPEAAAELKRRNDMATVIPTRGTLSPPLPLPIMQTSSALDPADALD